MLTPGVALPQALSALGALLMGSVILWAVSAGGGGEQLRALTSMPWGVVSLVDLYTGFSLFSGWIWFREAHSGTALGWTVAMMCLGFAAGRCVQRGSAVCTVGIVSLRTTHTHAPPSDSRCRDAQRVCLPGAA